MTPISATILPNQDHLISSEINSFLIDRQARRCSQRTIQYYQFELEKFKSFLQSINITTFTELTTTHIRQYLIELSQIRNPGGCHAAYRAIRAFLLWFANEIDDPSIQRLIQKVPPPKITNQPIQGISIVNFQSLLDTCDKSFTGLRDRAILLTLLDTGIRLREFTNLNLSDLDLQTGDLIIRSGKGNKDRTVFIGAVTRREIIRYLRIIPAEYKNSPKSPLWQTENGKRLKPSGLRQILRRRCQKAGIPEQSAHDFRRAFALQSLRNDINPLILQNLMGHSDLKTTQRYIALAKEDLRSAHQRSSPVDNL